MAIGNVQRLNVRKCVDDCLIFAACNQPDLVAHIVGGAEIEQRLARHDAANDRVHLLRGAIGEKHRPVCAPIASMWRVRSSSLSGRVFSCFLITSRSYSSIEKHAAMPDCTWFPI